MPDYEKYIAGHRLELAREKEKLAQLTRQAREKAKQAAQQLAVQYRVENAVGTLKTRVEREGIVIFDRRTIAAGLGKSGIVVESFEK